MSDVIADLQAKLQAAETQHQCDQQLILENATVSARISRQAEQMRAALEDIEIWAGNTPRRPDIAACAHAAIEHK